jgi:hypothetical protein
VSTGFPRSDAQHDFARARRAQVLRRLGGALRRSGDLDHILPFDEVVGALGMRERRPLGLRDVPLDRILGTVDRTNDFDRAFRPTSSRARERWERLATAARRGETLPPISLYVVGGVYFVRDGHHRVSVARALGRDTIDAWVTEIVPAVGPGEDLRLGDLPLKSHERVFAERVPLPPAVRGRIRLSDPWHYGALAEGVEAWGFRTMQEREELLTREQVAEEWFRLDYEPIVASLTEAGIVGRGETETEAYMRVVTERYRLLRSHDWNEDVLERLSAGSPLRSRRRT